MHDKCVKLSVADPKLFSSLTLELRRKRIPVVTDGEASIVISDSGKGDIIVRNHSEVRRAVARALCKLEGKNEFNELLVGIDSNFPFLTVAVIGDGELLEAINVTLPDLASKLHDIVNTYPHKVSIIGVGAGNPYGEVVLNHLRKRFRVRGVDERETNKGLEGLHIRDKDVRAAYLIAMRAARS